MQINASAVRHRQGLAREDLSVVANHEQVRIPLATTGCGPPPSLMSSGSSTGIPAAANAGQHRIDRSLLAPARRRNRTGDDRHDIVARCQQSTERGDREGTSSHEYQTHRRDSPGRCRSGRKATTT